VIVAIIVIVVGVVYGRCAASTTWRPHGQGLVHLGRGHRQQPPKIHKVDCSDPKAQYTC